MVANKQYAEAEKAVQETNDQLRLRSSRLLIILFTAILSLVLGGMLITTMYFKNGYITETLENGESISYYYFYNEKLTGWHITDGMLRYFSPDDGKMVIGWQKIDGVEYHFNESNGSLSVNKTVKRADGTSVKLDRHGLAVQPTVSGIYTEDDGTLALNGTSGRLYGWQEVDGIKYYFQKKTGRMLKNEVAFIDGKYFSFDANGIATEITGK